MEKESNTNCMNGTATMPSYFPCIKSSESHPLADWLYLKSVITSSPELRMMTETYRKRLAISKQFADQYKPEMPAITVSALMNGYGRQLADFLKPTYMLQLDFDHVKKEDVAAAYEDGVLKLNVPKKVETPKVEESHLIDIQ